MKSADAAAALIHLELNLLWQTEQKCVVCLMFALKGKRISLAIWVNQCLLGGLPGLNTWWFVVGREHVQLKTNANVCGIKYWS